MPLRGIIFDLDGVLVDTVPTHIAAWKRLFDEEGYAFDESVYHDKVDGRPREDGVRAVMVGASEERVLAAARRKEGYFLELIDGGGLRVFDDTRAFLEACRAAGHRLATASSSRNVRYILERAGLAGYFTAIVGGGEVGRGKPDPGIFLLAAERIGLDPASCVVVEDAVLGVQAARAGGFYCVGIDRTGDGSRLTGANVIAGDLAQVDPATIAAALDASER